MFVFLRVVGSLVSLPNSKGKLWGKTELTFCWLEVGVWWWCMVALSMVPNTLQQDVFEQLTVNING